LHRLGKIHNGTTGMKWDVGRQFKKVALLPGMLMLALLALTACDQQAQATPTPRPDADTLTLWRWESSPEEGLAIQQQVDAFLAANPAMSVTVQSVDNYAAAVESARAAGSLPDVLLLDGPLAHDLHRAGALAPLQASLTAPEEFHAVLREMFGADGVLWCAPRDASTLALAYNRDLFTASGTPFPGESWGWAEFRAAADANTDLAQGVFGLSLPADVTRLLPFIHMAGGSLPMEESGATSFAAPGVVEALTWVTDFGADDVSVEPIDVQSTWAGEAFGHQRAAMIIEGVWVVDWLAENFPPVIEVPAHASLPGLNVGYAELPAGAAGRSTLAFGTCYGVSASSANVAAAARLADFLTQGDAARLWANVASAIPARKPLADQVLARKPEYQPFIAGLAYAKPWMVSDRWRPIIDQLNDGIHSLYYEETTPAEVLAEADALNSGE
jgi:multiple sugar transport system substrate-binding protein